MKIFVGGADCGKSVVQQSKYTDVAVGQTTWARGNVVLEGGQFAIGAPTDYGLYFKFNSTYGMPYDPGAAYYQGTAYNPNPVTIGWKDMAADAGGDPCRLVAPADTWRLPTRSEIEALNGTAGDSLTLNGVLGQSYAGGALFVPTAGILYDNTGAGLAEYRGQGEFGYIWSSTRIYSMCFEEEVWRGLSRRGKLRSLSALREKRELCVLCFPYALDRPDIRRFRSDGYVQERLGRVPGSGQGRRRGHDGRCVENLADGPVFYSGK